MFVSLMNVGLRGFGLVLRFVLMAFLSRYANFETIGQYGLIFGLTVMAQPIFGFGLHFRMYRILVTAPAEEVGHRLRDRLLLHIAVFAPVAFVIAVVGHESGLQLFRDMRLVALVAGVTLGEIILGELHLTLLAIRQSVVANIVMFFRSAAWALPLMVVGYLDPATITVRQIILFWIMGQVAALLPFVLCNLNWPWREIWSRTPELGWILQERGKAATVFVGDIGNACGTVIDRFVLSAFLSVGQVGIYTFIWNLVNGMYQLVFAGVVQVGYPKFVAEARNNQIDSFRASLATELKRTLVAATVMGGMIFAASPFLDMVTKRNAIHDHLGMMAIMLLAFIVKLIADVLNYGMYANGYDRQLTTINILITPIAAVLDVIGLWAFGFQGIAWAVLATTSTLCGLRAWVMREHLLSILRSEGMSRRAAQEGV